MLYLIYYGERQNISYIDGQSYKIAYKDKPFSIGSANGKYLLKKQKFFRVATQEEIQEMEKSNTNKILIIVDNSIGDNFLTIPAINQLKKEHKNPKIDICVSKQMQFLYKNMANELYEHSDYHAGILKRESYNHFFKLAGSGRFHKFEHELDRIDIFVKNAGLRKLDKDCLEWKSYNIQPTKNNNIIIIPKASHPSRTWDLSCKKQVELCNKLLNVLENNQYIEIHCNDYLPQFEKLDNRIINMTGKLSTEQHVNRLAGCKYIVCCGDTGGIFVGAVFGVKGVALYGHVHPSTRLKYFPEIKYIYKEKACQYQPCEYLKRKFCNRACMDSITVEEVFEIIKEDLCK